MFFSVKKAPLGCLCDVLGLDQITRQLAPDPSCWNGMSSSIESNPPPLACFFGAGVLGAVLKRRYPQSRISLLDVDAFAVASSRLTLAANGLQTEVLAGDGIHAAPLGLAAILSNPPFHQGVHTSYAATEQLLRDASGHLQPGGELRLVANSFLQYKPLIEQHLGSCQTLADAEGFRIYQASKRG